jgi:tetratricopeptide (TPR) repeat protein
MLRLLRTLFVTSAVLASTAAWGAFIKGQVFWPDGRAADHIVIRLRSDKLAFTDEQNTDPTGKFDFDGLTPSIYVLSIEGQGFKPYSKFIDISMSKMSNEYITLQPEHPLDTKNVPPEGASAGINAREAEIPAAARKEYNAGQKLLAEKKDADGSIKHFLKAIQLYDKYSEAQLALGLVYLDLGKYDEAQKSLQRANELNPDAPGGYLALGTMFNRQKKYEDAEKTLSHGLELKPDVAEGQYELAKTYWATGKWQDAEPHAQKAAALAPDMAPVHVLLGNIALRHQDPMGAVKEFKQYLVIDPNGPMSGGVKQMIEKIEASQKK